MDSVLVWMNDNAGAVTGLAGIATAVATGLIAWLTGTLARENRRLREAGTEPKVVAYLLLDPRYKTMLNFVLANIGQGPALNVTFTFEADHQDLAAHNVRLTGSKDRQVASVLPQGERLVTFFGTGPELLREPPLKPFSVKIEYEDLKRRAHVGSHKLDVSEFKGLITLGALPEHEVAEALKKIAKMMDHWSSGYHKIKVEVSTREEEERRQREITDEMHKEDDANA